MVLAAFFALASFSGQPIDDPLARGFRSPPPSARPHTWWHWMDGNVTKEGITADLEAMKKVGIGGVQMFTVAQGIPKGPVDYMSPKWREMTTHAIREAGRLGIEVCLHNCAGWSSSGGPWVKPEHAMQVLAWSTVKVSGPKRFDEALPAIQAPQVVAKVDYAKDIAVFAFPSESEGDFNPSGSQRSIWLGKTGVIRMDGLLPDVSPVPAGLSVAKESVRNITSAFANGRLSWDVPAGSWTILRLGHVPTGKNNHPAPPEGDGLEVDKLSREAMDAFWAGTMATVLRDAGPLAGRVLNNALIDSYEVGSQNWTPKFREEFRKRRGYDCFPWILSVAGKTIDNKEKTERFLWDFRRTIADLYADNYFGYFAELCRKNGLMFSTEPYGSGGFDNLQVGGLADIPMGEFWLGGGTLETLKIAASAAHTNGRAIVGAESFTADDVRGRWLEEPYSAKALGDLVFCNGINRYIFHRYAHQPWMDKFPGMTMGPWGTHLERTQTWWTEAAEWLKYVARCQFLLQKGKFVADALYYYGESAPMDLPYRPSLKPALPAGYDFDGCDTTVLMKVKVENGMLVLPDGMSYSILVLPDSEFMSPNVATKVRDLARAGALILGLTKPKFSPSLVGFPMSDETVKSLANEVWLSFASGGGLRNGVHGYSTIEQLLLVKGVKPDFEFKSLSGGSKLAYIHRRIDDADVYFVSNQQYRPTEVECTFRVEGRWPELWHPDTGQIERALVFSEKGSRTTVPLMLGPAESVFVVFRKPSAGFHLERFELEGVSRPIERLPVVTIKRARYESPDGRGVDVTTTVADLVKQGNYEIPATNGMFGDPAVNVVKRLVMDFEIDGKPQSKTVRENETLVLIEQAGGPMSAAPYQIGFDEKGTPYFTPWKKGRYRAYFTHNTGTATVGEDALSMTLAAPWRVNFAPNWGAPSSVDLMKLISWSDHSYAGVKYFSGSAVYQKEFTLPKDMAGKDRAIMLDLGRVKNFATVKLNGRELAVLWKEPFAVDVSRSIRPGRNRLEVKVTNLWPNRIIGDEQLPPDVEWQGVTLKGWPEWLVKGQPRPKTGRYTFTTWKFWNKDSQLLESGLLGPVVIRSARKFPIPSMN